MSEEQLVLGGTEPPGLQERSRALGEAVLAAATRALGRPPGAEELVALAARLPALVARALVPGGVPAAWMAAAAEAIARVARRSERFTTDEVWQELRAAHQGPEPADPRAMGHAMAAAERAGLISKTKATRPSRRPACHHRPVRVWRVGTDAGEERSGG